MAEADVHFRSWTQLGLRGTQMVVRIRHPETQQSAETAYRANVVRLSFDCKKLTIAQGCPDTGAAQRSNGASDGAVG